jgi:hypothetical protein
VNLFILNIKDIYEPTRSGTSTVVQAPKEMVGTCQRGSVLRLCRETKERSRR